MSAPPAARPRLPRWMMAAAAVTAVIVAAVWILIAIPTSHAAAPRPVLKPCEARSLVPCYGQDPLHRVYGMGALYQRGITGAGTTIAVIAPYLDPWLASDLATYSRWLRLPAPQLRVIRAGHAPSARRGNREADLWAREITADLEIAHFMAPMARLIYLGFPPSDSGQDEATAMAALSWLVTRTHVDVASFSWGTYEPQIRQTPHWKRRLAALRAGLVAAARAHVTVVAGSDDSGPTIPAPGGHLARYRAVAWPTSDPLVTAVGSALLHTRPDGTRLRPDTVAGDDGHGHATGAGLSALYPRPPWQNGAAPVTGGHRGVVDVAMALSAWVYTHQGGGHPRWGVWQGTSVSAPMFAGLVADAAQLAGHPLGVLGPALYALRGARDGVLDITHGANTLGGVLGFAARQGYDLPSGIGTVGAALPFARALAGGGLKTTLISANTTGEYPMLKASGAR